MFFISHIFSPVSYGISLIHMRRSFLEGIHNLENVKSKVELSRAGRVIQSPA